MRILIFSAVLSLLLVPACAVGTGPVRDANAAGDTGSALDARTADAPLADLGPPDTGVPPHDAGGIVRVDTGGNDAGCSSSAACGDGLACNGIETCAAGACQPGTMMTCDDFIGCTDDSCVEPGGCRHVLNDMRCAAGQSCTPNGCMATSTCPQTPCRYNPPQCGCATGQGCYFAPGSSLCATAGTGASGTLCATSTDCVAGDMCLNFAATGPPARLCTQICLTDSDCNGGLCLITVNDGMGGTVPNLRLCTHPCNAVTQAGCPTGWSCDVFFEATGAMRPLTDCSTPVGTVGDGATCALTTDCAPGLGCVNDGTGLRCHPWCRFPGGSCPGAETCNEFAPPLLIHGIDYGACL